MKGKVKEKTGQATNNPDLMDQGTVEKVSGTVQKKIGQLRRCSRNNYANRVRRRKRLRHPYLLWCDGHLHTVARSAVGLNY